MLYWPRLVRVLPPLPINVLPELPINVLPLLPINVLPLLPINVLPLLPINVLPPAPISPPPSWLINPPPSWEINEPPSFEMTEPPSCETIEPPSCETIEPPSFEMTEPPSFEMTALPKRMAVAFTSAWFPCPCSTSAVRPVTRFGEHEPVLLQEDRIHALDGGGMGFVGASSARPCRSHQFKPGCDWIRLTIVQAFGSRIFLTMAISSVILGTQLSRPRTDSW